MSKKKYKLNDNNNYGFTKKCPYCGSPVVLRDSHYVYHNNKDYGKMWVCSNFPQCDSYVGCHPGTTIPLGRLADSILRRAKHNAHEAFDPLWKSGLMTRKEAYIWLSAMLRIPQEECHIGMFDVKTCGKVVEVCNKQNNKALQKYRERPRYTRGYKRK
jgi:ssDNA-binding Zn-finger/Zn-ribbon topoisomerase 1